jgi:CRISPR-associated protein Csx16
MKVLIITRHAATVEWLKSTMLPTDEVVVTAHYTPGMAQGFDYVVGILPIQLVAELCAEGIRYYQMIMDVPEEFRGKELSIEQMDQFNARLVQYNVEVV